MNNYSTNLDRGKILVTLTIMSVIIAYITNTFIFPIITPHINNINTQYPDLINFFTVVGIVVEPTSYLFLLISFRKLYNNKIWKWKLWDYDGKMPNISGIWKGELNSSFKKEGQETTIKRKVEMKIEQDYEKMSVKCDFYDIDNDDKTASSTSKLIGLYVEGNDIKLKFSYGSFSKELETNSRSYPGYNEFSIDLVNGAMEGSYYTGRDTGQSTGTMTLTFQPIK